MDATTTDQQIRELGDRWVRAEVSADVDALAELSTEDFTLVGPLGFILDRSQWPEIGTFEIIVEIYTEEI